MHLSTISQVVRGVVIMPKKSRRMRAGEATYPNPIQHSIPYCGDDVSSVAVQSSVRGRGMEGAFDIPNYDMTLSSSGCGGGGLCSAQFEGMTMTTTLILNVPEIYTFPVQNCIFFTRLHLLLQSHFTRLSSLRGLQG